MSSTSLIPHQGLDIERGESVLHTEMGVALRVQLGSKITRCFAFGVDLLLVGLAMIVMAIGVAILESAAGVTFPWIKAWSGAVLGLSFFVIRFYYFTWFEYKRQGQTIGKKLFGLRVVDTHGGKLSGNAILIRNLSREFELVVPVLLLALSINTWSQSHWFLVGIGLIWVVLIITLPFWNTRRARLGDLLGGTQVIRVPQTELLEGIDFMLPKQSYYRFSNEQLDMYGVYELNVLEEILRTNSHMETLARVCERITNKIAWDAPQYEAWEKHPKQFLQDFYMALRSRREQQQLFGNRQELKKEGVLSSTASD